MNSHRVICPSCTTPCSERFCGQCGERMLEGHDFSLRHFILNDWVHDLFDIDGKLLRTLILLLTRPGLLAQQWVAGKRVFQIAPMRLFVLMMLLLIFFATVGPEGGRSFEDRAQQDQTGLVARALHAREGQIDLTEPLVRTRLADREKHVSEIGTAIIFLAVALVQFILFADLHRRYLEHAVLALSVTTYFVFVNIVILAILVFTHRPFGGELSQILQDDVAPPLLLGYWLLAIRRFYGVSWLRSILSAVAVLLAQAGIATILNGALIALLILAA